MKFPFQLIGTREFDAVGFGTNAIDYLIRVPEYPSFNSKMELSQYTIAAGGEIASSMVGLSRLGLKTAYAGRFGDDHPAEIGAKSLIAEGVDIVHAEVIENARTQVAFIVIDERNGERTILWQRDGRLSYTADEAPIAAVTRGRVLHMTPHDTSACIRMASAAKKAGVIVSLDVDNAFEGIQELLPLTNVCIASSEFPQKLNGISDNKKALVEIAARYGCPVVGMTLGEAGSLFFCQDVFIETPAFPVPGGCIDTTGAGDAFRTGFLYGMLTGCSVETSAVVANAVAALKCRGFGARAALPNLADLNNLVKNIWT
jgi:sulfofructose kinase